MTHTAHSKPVLFGVFGAGLFISVIFLDSLRFKFTGHPTPEHIFTTLRDWSGIGLFYPAGPWIIGLAELTAAILLIALGVMSGAIFFHLFTPLGIETPTRWENGQIVEQGSFLFIAACISWVCAAFILAVRGPAAWRHLQRLTGSTGNTAALG